LNPIDKAEAYKRLVDEFGMTQEEVAERVGQNRATIANTIRLLALPQSVRVALAKGEITTGHAKAILSVETSRRQEELCHLIITQGLSVRAAEKAAARLSRPASRPQTRQQPVKDVHIEAVEEQLRGVFGTKVSVAYAKGKGKIEIEYYSDEDLDRILDLLRR
ncbi:MAG: ParB/RepB/Spo0J family partition protein, partial [Candidatus Hydrogenedentes bacterium]|nr:ParB/RepB/Spo0J family partition protein [Candidatus Hydrogenedentota bacterium]